MTSDVIVMGAGPAGAAAASVLAPHVRVTLLDRAATPVWRIGETLPGAARRVLAALGAWSCFAKAGHAPAPLKVSRWGSDRAEELDAMRDPDGAGWRLDRARFEADLRANAEERGARLLAPAHAKRLARSGAEWLVELSDGSQLQARIIIAAGGRHSRLMKPFGQRTRVMDRLACAYQLLPAPGASDSSTYTEAVADGWWYTALLPDGQRLVAFHGDSDGQAVRQAFREGPARTAQRLPGMAAALHDARVAAAAPAAFCTANSVARSAAGKGWLGAGDNTLALDPLSSQGLFNALVTGLQAGQSALRLLDGDQAAETEHAARLAAVWRAYVAHHALYYGMERRWPDAPFWRRRTRNAHPEE
jgi:flavin-dependent dehydrogenase